MKTISRLPHTHMKFNSARLGRCTKSASLALALLVLVPASRANVHVVSTFDNASSVTTGWYVQNWNGSTIYSNAWSTNDAHGSASSGSMGMYTSFATNQTGDVFRLPLNDFNGSGYTAVEFDAKVDPASSLDRYGSACAYQVGVFTTSAYNYHANYMNINPVSTNNGWAHYVVAASAIGGVSEWADIKEIFIQNTDGNYTNSVTNLNLCITYIDNLVFTGPSPTYSNIVVETFDDASFLKSAFTNWYGKPVTMIWTTNDAKGLTNSGSAEIIATFDGADNTDVIGLWFGTNGIFTGTFTSNSLNGTHYNAIEMDVMWDTNLSTVDLTTFNNHGDIFGMPLGIISGNGGQVEACGTSTTYIPNGASNGWVHIVLPMNPTSAGTDVEGLWFKKYQYQNTISGTVAYFIDNVQFDGGPILTPRLPMTLSTPMAGLECDNYGGSYDRDGLETVANTVTFVDTPYPSVYNVTIDRFPGVNYQGYSARVYWVPNAAATEKEPDWNEPTLLMCDIYRQANGTANAVLRCKTNAPASNGSLYVGGAVGNPSFASSKVLGTWTFTFLNDTNINIHAPDGTSTNLAFPLGLATSDVQNYFGGGGGMVVYYGSFTGGSGNAGQYLVLGGAGLNANGVTNSDNFTTDSAIDLNTWVLQADGGASSVYIVPPDTDIRYYLDWPATVSGEMVQTNNDLTNPAGWSTNGTPVGVQAGDHYHTVWHTSDLPDNGTNGNFYWRLVHPGP
ncbi:MAG TPA: hypothetical protein VN578_08360 [Candidatus Binatia bacterium]|nr:hypothetical protein [Candidatus Binatia bacterium]